MIRLTTLANKYERRTLRVLYGQTQAYPYDAQLDSNVDRNAGALAGSYAIAGAKAAVLPGQVAVKLAGEVVSTVPTVFAGTPYDSSTNNFRAFGLFANFVGGEMSDFPVEFDRVGVWRGVGSVYELLAPAFDDTDLSSDQNSEDGAPGNEIYLGANANGQLVDQGPGAYAASETARLLSDLSDSAIIVELLV